jgi:hypothetical protein
VKVSFFSYIYRNGLWISMPAFIMSAASLVYLIRDVIKVMKQAHLISVPLVEQQAVEFAEAGRVVLCMEGPRFTSRFANLSYRLIGPDGREAKCRRSWFRSHTSGVSKVRMELEYYEVSSPGPHTLQIKGLKPGQEPDADHRIVFMKPHLARSIANVIGIVLAGMLLIGSVVLFLGCLLSPGNAL